MELFGVLVGVAMIRRFLRDKRGVTAVFFGLTLPVIVGFLALGAETGFWFFKSRELQKIADIAAYNGAVELSHSHDKTLAVSTATKDAAFHGRDAATDALTVNAPPASGAFMNTRSVEVLIDGSYERLFSAIFSNEPVTISVRAVASYEEDGTACVLALSPTAGRGVEIGGNGGVTFKECIVMSNSISDTAVYVGGSSSLEAPCVRSVGDIYDSGGMTLTECNEPWPYSPSADDPYEDLEEPTDWGSCKNVPNGSTVTITPGRYCNGFTLKDNVTLEPGTYIIDGGSFRINAGANVQGEGVTFFMTDNADAQWNGSAHVDLSAPTSGDYSGVLVFADRDNTSGNLRFNGTADSSMVGAIYAPSQPVDILGDFSGSNGCTQIVAWTVLLSGSSTFSTDCTGTGLGTLASAGRTRLVE